jgi:PhzF family phenazine biosynthesis protein
MTLRPFKQVDVFSATPYFGNPLAVVLDGSRLDDAAMARFAHWTNLSETCFLLPPTDPAADYRVRIFTPGGELPFAGHPTLGSCHSWLQAGGQPRGGDVIVQECGLGLVKIRRQTLPAGQRLAFAAPPLKRSAADPALLTIVAAALGVNASQILAAQTLDNGPRWLALLLDSPETVLQLTPDPLALSDLQVLVGVAAFYSPPQAPPLIGRINREARAFGQQAAPAAIADAPDLEVRAFAACMGIAEDPVTGSLNASLAQWLIAESYAPERYLASQGVCLGRAGQVYIERDAQGQVWVGGESVTCIDGQVMLGT